MNEKAYNTFLQFSIELEPIIGLIGIRFERKGIQYSYWIKDDWLLLFAFLLSASIALILRARKIRNSEKEITMPNDTTMTSSSREENNETLKCDYLVVGAGTGGLSFVDTILTRNPEATIIIVDRNAIPGGHWINAYSFVKLHQPSCFYGVNSKPLGGKKKSFDLDDRVTKERFDIHDRATGKEVLDYCQSVCRDFRETQRVRFFFDAEYKFDKSSQQHTIVPKGPTKAAKATIVDCGKLVTVTSDVTVPSMRKPLIPVHDKVNFVPVNDILSSDQTNSAYKNYIVFGNGKTGIDAITYLLDNQIADPSQIQWIIPRDAWYFVRDEMQDFYAMNAKMARILLESKSVQDCMLELENEGLFCRLDTDVLPTVFKGAMIDKSELATIRSIPKANVIRRGRATSIWQYAIMLRDGEKLGFDPKTTLLVDCMVDNMYGLTSLKENFSVFRPNHIHLCASIFTGNVSFSCAYIAFLETCQELATDDAKNDCCYVLKGEKYLGVSPPTFLGFMYLQIKNFDALVKLKGGLSFMLNSRTNMNSPMHHTGGIWGMLWNFLGPRQLHRFGPSLVAKIERKGFEDIDHCFGMAIEPSEAQKSDATAHKASSQRDLLVFSLVSIGWLLMARSLSMAV